MSDQYQTKLEKIFSGSYNPKKQDLNKKTAEAAVNKDKTIGDRSGNQDTPVDNDKNNFLGTNPSGHRDKIRAQIHNNFTDSNKGHSL